MTSHEDAEDDADLQKAIATSLEQVPNHQASDSTEPQAVAQEGRQLQGDVKSENLPVRPTGLAGLDRKAMEQERLARAAARKRERTISPPPRKRARLDKNLSSSTKPDATLYEKANPEFQTLLFPRGVVKKTWAAYHPADHRTVRIEDIINKTKVRTAVLSTFMLDPDWILTQKFDMSKTKFYMILHAKDAAQKAMYKQDFDGAKNARVCLPNLTGMIGCQHSKLMLLFFAGYVRIVVPSANLVDFDWGESGTMENSAFVIDLPRRVDESTKQAFRDLPAFGQSLLQFLKNQEVSDDVRDGLLSFNFNATNRIAFIHTSAGAHHDADTQNTGLPSLSAAVRQLGLDTTHDVQVDFATSSIGSLKNETINSIYAAVQGKDITTSSTRERLKASDAKVKANMRIYFPTADTVKASIGGPDGAGTICLNADYWYKPDFPREIFRDYLSTRQGLLSHNKLVFVRGRRKEGNAVAWVYVGSANCSESAWGRMVTKGLKLSCNNWESGVLIPVESPPDDLSDLGKVFESIMDVPFEYGEGKGLEYGDRKPWFFMRKDR